MANVELMSEHWIDIEHAWCLLVILLQASSYLEGVSLYERRWRKGVDAGETK